MKLVKINDVPEAPAVHNASIRKKMIVENGAVRGISEFSRAVFPAGETTGSRMHNDRTDIFTCESGLGEIRVNDVGYVFSPGTTVVAEPGDVHEIINVGTADLVVTCICIESD